jgi:ABC-type bacteriocin/lantibiotic exporter with double-glycine peptidase domain
LVFLLPKTKFVWLFNIIWLWAYLMKVISETLRAYLMKVISETLWAYLMKFISETLRARWRLFQKHFERTWCSKCFWNNLHQIRSKCFWNNFIRYAQSVSEITFIRYVQSVFEITFIRYAQSVFENCFILIKKQKRFKFKLQLHNLSLLFLVKVFVQSVYEYYANYADT